MRMGMGWHGNGIGIGIGIGIGNGIGIGMGWPALPGAHPSLCPRVPIPPPAHQVISEARGPCYRVLREGRCALPTLRNITRQICCCSRVGKAWGAACHRCPPFGSGEDPPPNTPLLTGYLGPLPAPCIPRDAPRMLGCCSMGGGGGADLGGETPPHFHTLPPITEGFKEICPAGPGYHYSASDLRYNTRYLGQDLARVPLGRPRVVTAAPPATREHPFVPPALNQHPTPAGVLLTPTLPL